APALLSDRVQHVARSRLADDSRASKREVAAIPPRAARVVAVEVAHLLPRRPRYRRVPAQVLVQRRGTRLLRADDEEGRERPRAGGGAPERPDAVPDNRADRRRDARYELRQGHAPELRTRPGLT